MPLERNTFYMDTVYCVYYRAYFTSARRFIRFARCASGSFCFIFLWVFLLFGVCTERIWVPLCPVYRLMSRLRITFFPGWTF